eukprot:gene17301-19033_t
MKFLSQALICLLLNASISVYCAPQVTIYLSDNSIKSASYSNEDFPDIEKLFVGVKGSDVAILKIYKANIKEIDSRKLEKLPNLIHLAIEDNWNLKRLPANAFHSNKKLYTIEIFHNSISDVSQNAFNGTFESFARDGKLWLNGNKLTKIPEFITSCPGLKLLNLDDNPIIAVNKKNFANLPGLETLKMSNTGLTTIPDETFEFSSKLFSFDVSGSKNLKSIGEKAFVGATNIKSLILDNTIISHLPSEGLETLQTLSFKGVNSLWSISKGVINLPKLERVFVPEQRRFLCCAFEYKRSHVLKPGSGGGIHRNVTRQCGGVKAQTSQTTTALSSSTTSVPSTTPKLQSTRASNASTRKLATTEDHWGPWGRFKRALLWFHEDWEPSKQKAPSTNSPLYDFTDGGWGRHTVTHVTKIFRCYNSTNTTFEKQSMTLVKCYPGPDALRPCDEIMGNTGLTVVSWLVSFLAVVGNGVVFIVLCLSRRHFTVTKFLIINLVFADMCLGLYLFILTCASIDTAGEYYNSIVSWQYNGGCDVVGFLAVFSSELSMLVLTTITIERYLAIVYAINLQKRLSMRQASIMIGCSWFISILLALLPLTGVNNYNEVAICLPFGTNSVFDKAYLGFVLSFNSLLFMIVLGCYSKIYYEVAGPNSKGRPPSQTNDNAIAKRIALLVFTDFACWLPIAIVGIIAAAGYSQSINMTVEKSKYLLVIFFPINSVCNPFLYALSTKSFRREFFTVLAQCGFCRERLHKFQSNTYTSHGARKVDKKSRANTETMTIDVQYSLAAIDNHGASLKNKKATTPTNNPADSDPAKSNNNCMNNQADKEIAETSFNTAQNEVEGTATLHPRQTNREISVASSTVDETAVLTDRAVVQIQHDDDHNAPADVLKNTHIVETAIRF